MEHSRIEAENIVDRYLVGRLPPEDEELFEEHLFECTDCLAEVQAGEQMRRGLREVAAEATAQVAVAEGVRTLGILAWLRHRSPGQLAGLASLALAFVALPALFLEQQAEIDRLRQLAERPASRPTAAEPNGDFEVISLGVTRSAVAEETVIRRSAEPKTVLLSLELEEVLADRYRVTLRNETGGIVWHGEGLEPSLYDSLLVSLPPEFLAPGSYRLSAEAEGEENQGEAQGFRILVVP